MKINKNYKQNISHDSFVIRSVTVKIIQFLTAAIQIFNFIFLGSIKIPFWWYNEIHPNAVMTTSVYVKTRLKR